MYDDALTTLRTFATPKQTPWTVDNALAALEPFGDQIVTGLIESLQTEDTMLHLLALQIIQQIGSEATDAVPMIVAKLEGDDRCVRLATASALGTIGEQAKDALPLLDAMLGSNDEYARLVVADSMVRIDSESEKAISIIFNVLNNKTNPHKLFAAASLGERGNEDAVPDLKALLNDEDAGVRSEASLAIWKITGDSADALAVGRNLLDDPHWLVRQIGTEHFEQLGVVS